MRLYRELQKDKIAYLYGRFFVRMRLQRLTWRLYHSKAKQMFGHAYKGFLTLALHTKLQSLRQQIHV